MIGRQLVELRFGISKPGDSGSIPDFFLENIFYIYSSIFIGPPDIRLVENS